MNLFITRTNIPKGMKTPTTVYITQAHLDLCMHEIEEGHFETLSAVITYAMRFLLDHLQNESPESLRHIVRDNLHPVRIRLDDYVTGALTELGLFSRSEAPDFALDYYFRWKGLCETG